MSLTVLDPGPYSLLVDFGRPHHRSRGVPIGGAADRAAVAQGNALVGNEPDAVAVEFALAGPKLQADADQGCVIFGAPFKAWIDDVPIHADTAFNLKAGSVLRIGDSAVGMRGYLCVPGGFPAAPVLGSRTSFDALKRKDVLSCQPSQVTARSLGNPVVSHASPMWLRCLAGPQAEWFGSDQFFGATFQVSPLSNRMGQRLIGKPLTLPNRELVSEPVCPGTVQVVNDGQCIILGVDGQTIGGYPKIVQVIAADIDRIGQLRPGQEVRFTEVTLEEAEVAFRERESKLRHNLMRLGLVNW